MRARPAAGALFAERTDGEALNNKTLSISRCLWRSTKKTMSSLAICKYQRRTTPPILQQTYNTTKKEPKRAKNVVKCDGCWRTSYAAASKRHKRKYIQARYNIYSI